MAHFNLQNFQSLVLGQGLARTNRFEVFIDPPKVLAPGAVSILQQNQKVSLLCEQASFPQLNINTKSYRIYGPAYQRPVTSEYGGEGIPLTFHVDRNMEVKKFFDSWMTSIVSDNNYTVSYKESYVSQSVEIKQLDEADNYTYGVRLIDAFPRSMNLMELNNGAQNQTHRLTVLFAYRKWERTDVETEVVEATPVGRIGARITGGGYRIIPGTT